MSTSAVIPVTAGLAVRTPRTPSAAVRQRVFVASLVLLLVANGVPTAEYGAWQDRFGLSDAGVTAIYATAALGVLPALLLLGGLSDHIGRRPIVLAGLVLAGAGSAMFLQADGVGALVAGRLLVGLGVGTASGAITAALGDLRPSGQRQLDARLAGTATVAGIAAGPLIGGLLVALAPAPQRLVFVVLLLAVSVASIATLRFLPAGAPTQAGSTGSSRRPVLPAGSGALVATIAASWALLGFFASTGPKIAATTLGTTSQLGPILVVVGFLSASAVAQIAARRLRAAQALDLGLIALPLGGSLLVGAALGGGAGLLLIAALIGGVGQGLTHMATQALLSDRAAPERRAGVFSAGLLVAYTAGSVGPVSAGLLTDASSLTTATAIYAGAIALVAALAAVMRRRADGPGASEQLRNAAQDRASTDPWTTRASARCSSTAP